MLGISSRSFGEDLASESSPQLEHVQVRAVKKMMQRLFEGFARGMSPSMQLLKMDVGQTQSSGCRVSMLSGDSRRSPEETSELATSSLRGTSSFGGPTSKPCRAHFLDVNPPLFVSRLINAFALRLKSGCTPLELSPRADWSHRLLADQRKSRQVGKRK